MLPGVSSIGGLKDCSGTVAVTVAEPVAGVTEDIGGSEIGVIAKAFELKKVKKITAHRACETRPMVFEPRVITFSIGD